MLSLMVDWLRLPPTSEDDAEEVETEFSADNSARLFKVSWKEEPEVEAPVTPADEDRKVVRKILDVIILN